MLNIIVVTVIHEFSNILLYKKVTRIIVFLVKMSNSKLFNCIPEQIHLFQWLNFMLV